MGCVYVFMYIEHTNGGGIEGRGGGSTLSPPTYFSKTTLTQKKRGGGFNFGVPTYKKKAIRGSKKKMLNMFSIK